MPDTSTEVHSHEEINAIIQRLKTVGYICSPETATTVWLALQLSKPVLIEGDPGVGKTELAVAFSECMEFPLMRLQCYQGIDEARSIYEWQYGKQLLYTQVLRQQIDRMTGDAADFNEAMERLDRFDDAFYSEKFLLPRPLLNAVQANDQRVLLIDEIDKADDEFEAFLLEILSAWQVTVPELGTYKAPVPPVTFLTSNNTREIGDALRRRCLHLHIPLPDRHLESQIVEARVPDVDVKLREQLVAFVGSLREQELRKLPSISETIDWARTLLLLHASELDENLVDSTLQTLIKHKRDLDEVREKLRQHMNSIEPEAS